MARRLIRAVSQNAEMVHALGVDVGVVRSGVFGLGCAMAALGGVLAAPLLTAFLGMGTNIVIDAFVIVISEENGSIAAAREGVLYEDLDRSALQQMIAAHFGVER